MLGSEFTRFLSFGCCLHSGLLANCWRCDRPCV